MGAAEQPKLLRLLRETLSFTQLWVEMINPPPKNNPQENGCLTLTSPSCPVRLGWSCPKFAGGWSLPPWFNSYPNGRAMLQLWNALNSSGPPCTHVSGLAWDGWPRNGHEIMGNSRENRIILWYPDEKIWHMRQRYASGERFWFSNSRKIMISNLAWGSSMAAALNDLKVDHCIWKWSKSKIDIYLAIKAETNHFFSLF